MLAAVDDDVHALAQAHRRLRTRILEPAHAVDPRAGGVHDRFRAHANRPTVHRDLDRVEPDHLGVVEDGRAAIGGCADVRKRQPAVVRPRVLVERAGAEVRVAELRHELLGAFRADEPVELRARKRRVDDDARLDEPRPVRAVLVEREEEREAAHEMRRDDVHQDAALVMRLAHEPDVAEAEVAEAAVDELRRCARGRACEVALVDERDVQAGGRRGLGDPGADDAAADHEQVELGGAEPLDGGYSPVHNGFVQARHALVSDTTTRPNGARGGFSSRHAVIRPGGVALEDRRAVRIPEPARVRAGAAVARADERHALRRRAAHDDGIAVDLEALDRRPRRAVEAAGAQRLEHRLLRALGARTIVHAKPLS